MCKLHLNYRFILCVKNELAKRWDNRISTRPSPFIYIWFPYSRMMDCRKYDHDYHLHLYCTNLFQSEAIFQIEALNKKSSVVSIWIFHYRGVILLEVRCAANILPCSQTNMASLNLDLLQGSGLNNSIGPIARDCPKWPSGNGICVRSCPPNLCGWIFGQPIFSVPNYCSIPTNNGSAKWFSYWTTSVLILSMISYPLCSIYRIFGSNHHCTGPFSEIQMTKFEKYYSISNG